MLPERVAEGVTEAAGRGRLLAGCPALRHRSLRLFVAGHGISLLGFWMQSVAVAGYGMIRYTATTNTLLQLLVDERYRGRMMGRHTVMFLGTALVGGFLLGALAQRCGAPAAVVFSGSVAFLAAAWLAVRLRRLERRDGTPRAA